MRRIPYRNAFPGSRTLQPDRLSEYRVTVVLHWLIDLSRRCLKQTLKTTRQEQSHTFFFSI